MKFNDLLQDVFDEGTEEYNIIKDTYDLITDNVPSIAAECKTNLILLDNCRVKLATLYYQLGRSISRAYEGVQQTHDQMYMRLVKLGRPSKEAIESEIRATNPEYSGVSKKVSLLEEVRNLVSMYMRCVDSRKQTTTELLRNINRID